jgi:hypothetical protein
MNKGSNLYHNIISKRLNLIYLALILIGAFIVRIIPSRHLTFAGNDAYLHHDIVLRLSEQGLGMISSDPASLMGLKDYAYPPLYHIIGTLLYNATHSELIFFIIPPILGVATIFVFYKIAQELFENGKTVILSTLLFAFVPAFVTRTSVFIPESLGLLLFTSIIYFIIKYVKSIPNWDNINNFALKGFLNIFKGNYKYLILAAAVWVIYLFTHRGWVFLAMAILILVLTLMIPSFKKKPVTIAIPVILAILAFIFIDVSSLFARFQEVPVSVLGFPKWVGLLQLVLGIYGAIVFIKSKNPLYKFISLWGILFLLVGSYSFRFRDPYAAIPLAIMAGYVFSEILLPKLSESSIIKNFQLRDRDFSKPLRLIIIFILVMTPVAQGAFTAYSFVVQPSDKEVNTFNWINENTPANAIILTMKDEAYLLIGNTHRKDIILWKTVYQGFMGDAPPLAETVGTQNDVGILFGSAQENEAYYLLDKYNVSYIYITSRMYTMPSAQYGLITYMPFDTHFKTSYITGDSSVYQYISNPTLMPPTTSINLTGSEKYSKTVNFIEKFWNGYAYSDFGGSYYADPNLDLEFGGSYKGSYDLNAQIATLYNYIYQQDNNQGLNDKSDYLINWLNYKQMSNGSFPSKTPPGEYTLGTMQVLYPLLNTNITNSNKTQILNNGLDFVNNQVGTDSINISNIQGPERGILGRDYITLKTDSQVSGMYPENKENIVYSVISEQDSDGSWTSQSYQNIEILKGLALYYQATDDPKVLDSIKKGTQWLQKHQTSDGAFKDDGDPKPYGINHYADALLVYQIAGDNQSAQITLKHIMSMNINTDINPLKSYLTMISDLSLIYGEERAIEISNKLL